MSGHPAPQSAAAERSSGQGLSTAEAARRLLECGPNALPAARRSPAALLLARQLTHFFALLLWAAAALAALAGMPQLSAAIIIVIVVNGVFAFIQEHRADRSVDRLRDLMPARAVVRRDGQRRTVPVADLVPGDVVLLEAGDKISADMRALSAAALAVDESLLTGESVPRRVAAGEQLFAGTFVVEGAGEASVTATGAGTRLAGIAALTRGTHRPPSPPAVRLGRVVQVVAAVAVAVGVVLFGVGLLLGLSPLQGFLFALGVTVALVPEGLLPTVTLALAYGAHAMARRNALVRHLEAVETLGSVTFICTDKTGTLTCNQMSAVQVWTPSGSAHITGQGYEPRGRVDASPQTAAQVAELAYAAARASRGRLTPHGGNWQPHGDPMEVALHVLALRCGVDIDARAQSEPEQSWLPFDPVRLRSASLCGGTLYVKGAPELAPFVAWALTGGAFPLAIGVLQILALDIGTDLLPALALGAEPPNPRTLTGRARTGQLIDRRLLARAFGVLGPAEVLASLGAFTVVLLAGGWRWGQQPSAALLAMASGTAFAAIVLGQLANAFACRSESRPAFLLDPRRNPLLLWAVATELVMLCLFLGVPPVATTLGGSWPPPTGWALAVLAVPVLLAADTLHKAARAWRVSTRPAAPR